MNVESIISLSEGIGRIVSYTPDTTILGTKNKKYLDRIDDRCEQLT